MRSRIKEVAQKCDPKEYHDKIILMKQKMDNLKSQNENCIECGVKDTVIKELRDIISELKTRLKEVEIESDDRFANIQTLQDEVKQKSIEMHDLSTQTNRLQNDFREMKADRDEQDLSTQTNRLQNDFREMKADTDEQDLSTQTNRLQNDFREMKADTDEQAEELNILKSKILLRVNLFCHHRSNIITNIEQALMINLKDKIEENQLELNFVQFTDNFDDNGDPTIVLCLTTSHVEHDATYAVKELNVSAKTALLMIHHKDEHALPLVSSRCVLTSPRFKQLGCITDMAYLSGKGFFPCEINNSSIVRLVNFIRKEGVKHRKYEL